MDTERITLALGPTNTGKTHRAVERLLEHDSGMIGLPLRLLAREVYDRITARIGERDVALVTGEEKRVPARPRYWVCTVEAMPVDLAVDFLAVDEIQLAAHRERGHVFTDRFLHARGRLETWFLGADTMAPIARELLPGASIRRHPRLSTLTHTGRSGLGGLPPRSAVVAFSANEVYEIAARLKARRGGAAVVLGALSPRTRNAQVALYQAGEVQYLVATDAIGMGLNLDVDHVAFASTRKFDGREHRPLAPAELAQIAGRAGRYKRDGTFGTLNPEPKLPDPVASRIEEHRFGPVRRLVWRNAELDYGSLDALVTSLTVHPPNERFVRVEQADDFDALRELARRPEVRARAVGEARLRLLWDVCQVPDYRKLLLLRHIELLAAIYVQLVEDGRVDEAWVEQNVRRIDRVDGDLDTLTARLAAIRVWTYVSHRSGWLAHPARWQERTREVEDRLGDALHERLVDRFVELRKKARAAEPAPAAELPADGPFAQLRGLLEDARAERAASRRDRVEDLVEAPHEAFVVDDAGLVRRGDEVVGRLVAGRELAAPEVRADLPEHVGAGARSRVERRLVAFAKDWVAELLAPLRDVEAPSPAVRGLLYQLEQGLGTVARREAREQLAVLAPEDHEALGAAGVVVGRRTVHARPMLAPESLRRRALLVRLQRGEAAPKPPAPGAVSVRRRREVPNDAYLAVGFVPLGPRAIRADQVERALDALDAEPEPPKKLGSWLGVRARDLPRVLSALGVRG
ncbi:MAG TPA: helicase-related protein [Sandaracinaceae bacterium LLY-WYZ-13_1]|nr:helicase-related protein [Sandaracinaceae bacterium LLY-WYZ-13_1]